MSILDKINIFDRMEQTRDLQRQQDQAMSDQFGVTPTQATYLAAQFAPGMGMQDAAGEMPGFPPADAEMVDIFSAPNEPSMAENIRSGGLDRYLIAPLQGLGVVGDAAYGIPAVGGLVGGALKLPGALAAVAGGVGKAKKGITALDDTKKMLKADVDAFARDDTGFVSPTLKALIERAPANLKGKQITDWLNANANKGVKPKELEYLGFDDYLAANPTATVREAVQGVSGNKVKVTRTSADDAGDNAAPLLEFDVQVSRSDPLDGSSPWDANIADIIDDPEPYEPFVIMGYNALIRRKESSLNLPYPKNMVDNLADAQDGISKGLVNMDEVAEEAAEFMYMDNPYKTIQPMTEFEPGNYDKLPAFAYGNDEVGYQLFVNGERKTNPNNVPYSQTEAQIQLRNVMQDEFGTDPFRIQGEDDFYFDNEMAPRNYQDYVDESLPGGENYRQVLFRWENAPKGHNATDHFDDPQAIAHALVRDRKLADGTDSLHVDELQSDVHTQGAKNGYRTPPRQRGKIFEKLDDFLKDTKYSQEYKDGNPGIKNSQNGEFISFADIGYISDRYGSQSIAAKKETQDLFRASADASRSMYGSAIADDLINNFGESLEKMADILRPINTEGTTPNYPFKDDWHNMSLQQLVLDAIENGKDTISVSGSQPMIARYSDKYATFYETLYDKKIPSAMKKLANKYGGKFEKVELDLQDIGRFDDDEAAGSVFIEDMFLESPAYRKTGLDPVDNYDETFNLSQDFQEKFLESNILRITPEMKAKVLEEGFPGFALGGEVSTKGIKALGLKGIVMPKEVDLGIGSIR